jgi:hypothetical protein
MTASLVKLSALIAFNREIFTNVFMHMFLDVPTLYAYATVMLTFFLDKRTLLLQMLRQLIQLPHPLTACLL